LVNWDEGGYTVHNKPYPRREIHVGGDIVSVGYYNTPGTTAEEFYNEIDDLGAKRRWFRTGDIGKMLPQGICKIVGE
jgi:long-chain acyl-CoA synthetase